MSEAKATVGKWTGRMGKLTKWMVYIVVILCFGPALVFGAKLTSVSWDYCFGKDNTAEKDTKVLLAARSGDQAALSLIESQDDLLKAERELESAVNSAKGLELQKDVRETYQRLRKYSQRQVLADVQGISSSGTKKIEKGTVVRYYPLVKSYRPLGDTKTYVMVGLAPYTTGNFWFVPEEFLDTNKLEEPKELKWYPANPDDSRIVRQWAIVLAPGQESPEIQLVPDQPDLDYWVQYNHRELLLWSVNGSQWQEVPKVLPAIDGVGRLKFKLSPFAEKQEPIKVSHLKRS